MQPKGFAVEDDGDTHIRIDVEGKTRLGRYLANTARTPFKVPKFGAFESMEGFWFAISTGKMERGLHTVYGLGATLLGRKLEARHNPKFRELIIQGLRAKVTQSPVLLEMLRDNELPFGLYEIGHGGIALDHHAWYLNALNEIVKEQPWHLINEAPPSTCLDLGRRKKWTETVAQ